MRIFAPIIIIAIIIIILLLLFIAFKMIICIST
jgi:hypothetical protein